MQNEIMGFLSRHNGGKTAEIAEALAVTDYQARYYLLLLEKEGMVQRSPLRRGMATYWFLKRYGSALSVKTRHGNILVSERRKAGGTKLFFHNLITQFVGMLH